MPQDRDRIEDQAVEWVIRQRDPAFADWDGFADWMAQAPAHAEAYHVAAIADQDMADLLATPVPKPLAPPAPRRAVGRRAWISGAIAASLAGVIGWQVIERQPALYSIETIPGTRRTVTLPEGTVVMLNGGTRLTLDGKDPRHAVLERGEALFAVVHDEARPFSVAVGGATLLDVGTRFNVLREGGTTEVQVSEGAVVYNPKAEAVRLDPGKTLRAVDGQGEVTLGTVAPDRVAGWTSGRLVYDGQPLAAVAADLARYAGRPVRVAPALAARPFHGALNLGPDGDLAKLGPLLDVEVRRDGAGWALAPAK
ncbi:FecR domain-containing protein [Sphingomonas naphthae]|uniref:FecR domain-containing protein n=1 Tax=Sphingomonas naphthae TaxID=1813468 RepID=A0ABY7TQ97_9SPHN|nr:FecR domain-containing protein [Sphingomonas naphthae]WCT74339.1 FecR domain-containing protein [Sphingomonas naphthae]